MHLRLTDDEKQFVKNLLINLRNTETSPIASSAVDKLISYVETTQYDVNGTVVVVLVPWGTGLIMVQRALADGYGMLALPGGFQHYGEDWQDAGVREVAEETGIKLDKEYLKIVDFTNDQFAHNLVFAEYVGVVDTTQELKGDHEVLQVLPIYKARETAFPIHTRIVKEFFERREHL